MDNNKKHRKVIDVTDDISIYTDPHQYVIRYYAKDSEIEKEERSYTPHYFPTLRMCFQNIFEEKTKKRLGDEKVESMEKIIEIFEEERERIEKLMRPLEKLDERQ